MRQSIKQSSLPEQDKSTLDQNVSFEPMHEIYSGQLLGFVGRGHVSVGAMNASLQAEGSYDYVTITDVRHGYMRIVPCDPEANNGFSHVFCEAAGKGRGAYKATIVDEGMFREAP